MEYLNRAFFSYICVFLILSACNKKDKVEITKDSSLDSVSFYVQKMQDPSLADTICLKYVNKAISFSKTTPNDSISLDHLLSYKMYFFSKLKEQDSTLLIGKKTLQEGVQNKDSLAIANSSFRLAYYFNLFHKKDSAFYYYKRAKNTYLKLNDSAKVGEILINMAIIQSEYGDYHGSDITAIQALKYLDKNNVQYLTSVYNCIAISAKMQKDYEEAIYWYDKAIEISTNEKDKISYLNNKANAFRYLKEYDKSIEILDDLLKDSLLVNQPKTKARILDNLAYNKWLANPKDVVIDDLLRALTIRVAENDLNGLIASYAHLSDYYKTRNEKEAQQYASKMYAVATAQKSPQDQLEALQKLISLGNSSNLKAYYNKFVQLSDSLNEAELIAKNKFAKLQFDTEKTREEKLELQVINVENKLKLEEEKSRNIIGASLSAVLVLVLIGFGFYSNQKYKQEKRLEVYKTETRIAKKIHDEVANNVVNVMNKLQYTTATSNEILDDLDKVYLLTRDISHENSAIETGNYFEVYLNEMLKSFNSDKTIVIVKDIQNVELNLISKENQIEVYRILQELMVNMRKHSKAALVAIVFKNYDNQIQINYSDNGVGIDLFDLKLKNGLQNVETRIKSLNGTIKFETSIQNGFKAFISFKK